MNVVVVAPHPDDETFGCGGTLLRHAAEGDDIHWIIVTRMDEKNGCYSDDRLRKREGEISRVTELYGFKSVHKLGFLTTSLDAVPMSDIVGKLGVVLKEVSPSTIYLPSSADVHTDHQIVNKAAVSCCKGFRFPSIKRVLAYETLSETDFCLNSEKVFVPNFFVDISEYLDRKIEIAQVYEGELGLPPFPRSCKNIKALSVVRGSMSGFFAAEAFTLLKEIR